MIQVHIYENLPFLTTRLFKTKPVTFESWYYVGIDTQKCEFSKDIGT